jgi:hypothetical protein
MSLTEKPLTREELIRKRWPEVKELFNPDLHQVVGLKVPAKAEENNADPGGDDFLEFRLVRAGFANSPSIGSVVCEGILFDPPPRT